MDNTQSEAMKKAQELIKQKDDIEAEIRKAQEELQSQKVGMNEKLVDNNGFPRSDIDLVLVTTARSNIVRLKNDHKAIMDKIEEALHAVHAEALAEKQRSSNMANTQSASTSVADKRTGTKQDSNEESLIPFARVNAVAPDSPAKDAGLMQGDRIVAFGTINIKTSNIMASLSEHVQSRENKPIIVRVLRGVSTELHSLILVPKQGWGGRGLLGCHIVPA